MKRTILFLVAAIAIVMGAKAQQQTATLQQGALTKIYYGQDAFKEAYSNAQNGAKIILSAGVFNQVDSIAKSITIIGNGGLLAENCTSFSNIYRKNEGFPGITDNTMASDMLINANNVKVEGVYMDRAILLRSISGLHLSRCYISKLFCTGVHTNTIIDQCYLKADCSEKESNNCCIKNCFVEGFHLNPFDKNSATNSTLCIINSLILRAFYFLREGNDFKAIVGLYATIRNSIIGSFSYGENREHYLWNGYYLYAWNSSGAMSQHNVLFLYPYHYDGTDYEMVDYLKTVKPNISGSAVEAGCSAEAYDNIFNESVPWYDPAYINTTVLGDDGTVVGPYGGTGFSLYPSIPRITESKIDTYTNGEGKLNVKVKVEVGQ